MPFRDAGYSQADFTLTVQDIVYGVWRAKEEGICGLKEFNLEEYSQPTVIHFQTKLILREDMKNMKESTWEISIGCHQTLSPLPLLNMNLSLSYLQRHPNTQIYLLLQPPS